MSTATTTLTYVIDPAHTTVAFVIRHMMIARVRGHFNGVSGAIELSAGSKLPSRVDATIETASIDTREAQRDAHLKSPDFFDAATSPHITFHSTRIEGDGVSFRVFGDLTIRGTTREVSLKATFEGAGTDPWGNERIGFEAHATINRRDFGLGWNQALETGGVLVGDEVRIELSVEAIAQS